VSPGVRSATRPTVAVEPGAFASPPGWEWSTADLLEVWGA